MQIESNQPAKSSQSHYLDSGIWKSFQNELGKDTFYQSWLTLQAAMIGKVSQSAIFLRRHGSNDFVAVAMQPVVDDTYITNVMLPAVEMAFRQNKGVAQNLSEPTEHGQQFRIAYPVTVDDATYAVVVIELFRSNQLSLRVAMRQLQWGASWIEANCRRGRVGEGDASALVTALELVAMAVEQPSFVQSATAVATELAAYFHSDRVSFGFLKGHNIRVLAISNTANFDKKTNIVRALGRAMDEAMDQQSALVYPQLPDSYHAVTAQQELLKITGAKSLCTIPLIYADKVIGGMCIEHIDSRFFSTREVNLCKHIALLLGPILELQRRESRWIARKNWDAVSSFFGRLFGPRHLILKLVVSSLMTLTLFFSLATGTYRVSAKAYLEGWTQQYIASPVNGFIASSEVRAGDYVEKGQLLFRLENKDLLLEQKKWQAQKTQLQKKYRDAFVQKDKAQTSIYRSQLSQADAQLELIAEQLSRVSATAPFAGVVVKGDLDQRLGSPVEKGETLLHLAPLDAYRIIIDVDERDIIFVQLQQRGELNLSAIPDQRHDFTITKITPVAIAEEGVNTFRIEARLDKHSDEFIPGMQGNAKIEIGKRKLLWIWTHRMVDWMRTVLWYWWP